MALAIHILSKRVKLIVDIFLSDISNKMSKHANNLQHYGFGVNNNNNNNNNTNLTFIMRLANAMQTQMRMSLHIGKMHDQHLEASCRGISSC